MSDITAVEPTIFIDRDLSWLSFNERVLQEADDDRVPLAERLRFLAIYSSNLDEFYKVRVAHYKALMAKDDKPDRFGRTPKKMVKKINKVVDKQQARFGVIFRNKILPAFAKEGVNLYADTALPPHCREAARKLFTEKIAANLVVEPLCNDDKTTFLEDQKICLGIELAEPLNGHHVQLIPLPTEVVPRTVLLDTPGDSTDLMLLDDVLRVSMDLIFPDSKVLQVAAIKMTRDGDLYLDDQEEDDLVLKVRNALSKRKIGAPSRFLYDQSMTKEMLKAFRRELKLKHVALMPGGKYHNFSDFFSFPLPDEASYSYEPKPTLRHPELDQEEDLFAAIREKDRIIHYPYQSFDDVIRLLEQAAADPQVTSIKSTLYRVAKDSKVVKALIKAAENGKKITVFVEVKARFDEQTNIYWMDKMREAGITILPNFDKWKVHAKIFLITRTEGNADKRYTFLATGNFNEKTAKIYCDQGLMTAHDGITKDVDKVFDFLENTSAWPTFKHLWVAPYDLNDRIMEAIDREIALAQAGKEASLIFKMNSLEDPGMIEKIYEAGKAGVKVDLIIRGICCLNPNAYGVNGNIKIRSIIDRYLEHARAYIFGNDGNEQLYMASADLMRRNLHRRVEVAFPIYNEEVYSQIRKMIELQLADDTKARILGNKQKNKYAGKAGKVRSQYAFYDYLKSLG